MQYKQNHDVETKTILGFMKTDFNEFLLNSQFYTVCMWHEGTIDHWSETVLGDTARGIL
jgi:hypothetical protein